MQASTKSGGLSETISVDEILTLHATRTWDAAAKIERYRYMAYLGEEPVASVDFRLDLRARWPHFLGCAWTTKDRYRNQGIMSEILPKVMVDLVVRGVKSGKTWILAGNAPSEKVAAKVGFVPSGPEADQGILREWTWQL